MSKHQLDSRSTGTTTRFNSLSRTFASAFTDSKSLLTTTYLIAMILLLTASLSVRAQNVLEMARPELKSAIKNADTRPDIVRPEKGSIFTPSVANSANYAFSFNNGGSFTDMTGSVQLVGPTQDDTASVVTSIPFDFYFMGTRFNQFSASSNGYIRLGSTAVATTQYTLGTAGVSILTPMGSDEFTSTTGKVHYKITGSAPNRVLTVEFLNMTVIYDGAGATADCTFEVRLHETTGVIEFVYGSMNRNASLGFQSGNDPQYIGFSTGATAGLSGSIDTADTPNFSAAPTANHFTLSTPMSSLNSPIDGSRKTYLFTPPVPTAPSGVNFTNVSPTSMTVNWVDNSSNETQFLVYRSTDGTNFAFRSSVGEGVTTFADTSLSPNTTYFYQVYSVSEGALSSAATASQATSSPGNISCNGSGGNWSSTSTWSGGVLPTNGDDVTIQSGCTVTVDVTTATALDVTVQNGGTLQYLDTTASTLTVGINLNVDLGGTVSAGTGSLTTHVLSIGGNLTNNGTLDLSTTAGVGLTFTGAANSTFGGSGAVTDIRTLTINKGTSNANILELNPTNFTVQGTVIDGAPMAFLTLTNGTLKVSGNFTVAGRVFTAPAYTIGATTGFWLKNPNFTVVGQAGSATLAGMLRVSQGTFNVGTATGNSMGFSTGSSVIIDGGTVVAAGRFGVAAAGNTVTYNESSGTVTVQTAGNTSTTLAGFDLGTSIASSVNVSGGTVIVQLANTAASGPRDYRMQSGSGIAAFTGGTLQLGNTASGAAKAFTIRGVVPNLVIDNTSAGHSAAWDTTLANYNNISLNITINTGNTLNLGNVVFLFDGTVLTNNGTLTHNGASSNLVWFNAAAPILYTGSGTVTAPLTNFGMQADQGLTINPGSPNIPCAAIRLFSGSITNASRLTLGNGGATTGVLQIGNTTTPTAAGNFDSQLTFNLGTGGENVSYLRTNASRVTGPEINPGNTVTALTYDENDPTHTLTLGGNLTVSGTMTLTNGVIFTQTNSLVHNGTLARTNGYVDGTVGRSFSAIGSYTYPVGQNGYSPVTANVTALGTTPSILTVKPVDSLLAGFDPAKTISRYWQLSETGDLTADVSFNYQPADIAGNEADYRVYGFDGTTRTNFCSAAPCVVTATHVAGPATGVTSFAQFTVGEFQIQVPPFGDIQGQTITSSNLGLGSIRVTLSGGDLAQPLVTTSSAFGKFAFTGLTGGMTYTVTISPNKKYAFDSTTQLVTITNLVNPVTFTSTQ